MAKIVEKCLEEEWAEEDQQQMTIKLMPELATIQRFSYYNYKILPI
jgi:hypothetical protein